MYYRYLFKFFTCFCKLPLPSASSFLLLLLPTLRFNNCYRQLYRLITATANFVLNFCYCQLLLVPTTATANYSYCQIHVFLLILLTTATARFTYFLLLLSSHVFRYCTAIYHYCQHLGFLTATAKSMLNFSFFQLLLLPTTANFVLTFASVKHYYCQLLSLLILCFTFCLSCMI